ncbi:asparagine synthetase B family protein, partial [bacterium]|nr:asparagine synthetase B family protein [bacterium]
MTNHFPIDRVVDLTDASQNFIYNMSLDQARQRLISGETEAIRQIDGQFALVAAADKTLFLTRSIGRPLRYFIAKKGDGPCLVAADRIDAIFRFLREEGLHDQFHPSYTRMAPAHYITEIQLVGCPDPN